MTPEQLALIHVAKKQLDMDDKLYREVLEQYAGVKSARDLCPAGFQSVMAAFERMGFKPASTPQRLGRRPGFASDAQLELIRSLWQAYAGTDDERGLNSWLEKWFKISNLRFLPGYKASRAIEALKKMSVRPRQQERRDHGPSAA
jgi:phage gp16-like protein